MGLFKNARKQENERGTEYTAAAEQIIAARASKIVGNQQAANDHRRAAARHTVNSRYAETDRCSKGHRNCTATDH